MVTVLLMTELQKKTLCLLVGLHRPLPTSEGHNALSAAVERAAGRQYHVTGAQRGDLFQGQRHFADDQRRGH
uniref:Uncharacterized protein n=1 Tax=Pseudomonas cannabina TaxID=86840 RepID=I0BVY3_PSECA|nr:hypothetical protein [Pseudomonas cannabina]